jgi:hypothetical protein
LSTEEDLKRAIGRANRKEEIMRESQKPDEIPQPKKTRRD